MHLRGERDELLRVGQSNGASIKQVVAALHSCAIGTLQEDPRGGSDFRLRHSHLHASPQF